MMFPKGKKRPKNEMDAEEFKKAFPNAIPKKVWGEKKSSTMKPEHPEAYLQEHANGELMVRGIKYLRFSDAFLRWMRVCAPAHIGKIFFDVWGGQPDNMFIIPITEGYHLLVNMELKTQDSKGRKVGALHGKQKINAKRDGWFVPRSVDQINKVITDAELFACKIKKMLRHE